jgi:hypothetical protein
MCQYGVMSDVTENDYFLEDIPTCRIHIGRDTVRSYMEIRCWHSKALKQTSLYSKLIIHNGHTLMLTLVHISSVYDTT